MVQTFEVLLMTEFHILNGPDKGLSFYFREGTTYIGRSRKNDIQSKDETVSRCRVRRAAFVPVHPETGKITWSISKPRENKINLISGYSEEVVYRVLTGKKPLVIVDTQADEMDEELAATLKMRRRDRPD